MADGGISGNGVEYRLFPHLPEDSTKQEIEQYLEEQIEIYFAHLSLHLVKCIWQNEPFYLRPVITESETGGSPPHLIGHTDFGDNVDDEWFIVYLLQSLTEEFPGLVAQVNDNDGEFMLIEAANSLPKWVNPDTAENRVYLYESMLHVIPYPLTPAHIALLPTETPSHAAAIRCIRENPTLTMARANVQEDIHLRLQGYPDQIEASIHHAHCYVPASLAAVLDHSPSLIAPIVQAFYYRDPIDLKSCLTFHHFPPGTRVMRRLTLTRCLYAQLLQQRFTADRRSGYTTPAPSNPKYKAYDLGLKLAHGAEILCSKHGIVEDADDPLKVLTSDPRWHRYLATLNAKGYFRDELEGSKLYKQLLEEAKRHFVETLGAGNSGKSRDPGVQIRQTLKQVVYDIEEMRKEEQSLEPPDDDGWIEISPEELDAMLAKASGKPVDQSDTSTLNNMTQGVKAFINKVSSHEGAELPIADDGEIQFDPNSFMQTMHKVFDFEDSDDASSSDMSEYGSDDELNDFSSPKKPLSKSASQGSAQAMDEDYLGIKDYMDLMDRELAKTNIGQSFEKERMSTGPKAPPRRKKQARMAATNSSSTASSTQSTPQHHKPTKASVDGDDTDLHSDDAADIDDLDDDFEPVNIDLNIVKNMMESYSSQSGLAGPASNMMGSLGIRLPHDGRDDGFC